MPDINKPRIADIIKNRLNKPGADESDDNPDLDSLRNYEQEG